MPWSQSSDCVIDQNFKYFVRNQISWSKLSDTYLNQKQLFTDVYSHLQRKAYSWVFLLLKLQFYSLKKGLHQRWFPVVSLIFQNSFLAKHVWVVTASAKYHLFSLLRWPHQQCQPAWMRLWEVSCSVSETSQRRLMCKTSLWRLIKYISSETSLISLRFSHRRLWVTCDLRLYFVAFKL